MFIRFGCSTKQKKPILLRWVFYGGFSLKIFKYVVVSNARPIGLFPAVIEQGFFAGWRSDRSFTVVFGVDPVLFRRSHARFLARELRRSGYCVSAKPYLLFMLRAAVANFITHLHARRDSKRVWQK